MGEKQISAFSSKRGILAGLLIGMGGTAFLSVESKALGSFLFAVGLLTVILQKYSLFTGKVGYAHSFCDVIPLAKMLLRNFVGAALAGLLVNGTVSEKAAVLAEAKLEKPLIDVFVAAIFCGILIYAAVELFAKLKHPLSVIMPIMMFILCGFEHCVANTFYFAAAGCFNLRVVWFTLVCIAGNTVGSLAVRAAEKFDV